VLLPDLWTWRKRGKYRNSVRRNVGANSSRMAPVPLCLLPSTTPPCGLMLQSLAGQNSTWWSRGRSRPLPASIMTSYETRHDSQHPINFLHPSSHQVCQVPNNGICTIKYESFVEMALKTWYPSVPPPEQEEHEEPDDPPDCPVRAG